MIRPLALVLTAGLAGPLAVAEDHSGHEHAKEHNHGQTSILGIATLGTQKAAVTANGEMTLGQAWHLEVALDPATPAPKALRLWVGTENGRGSVKAKAEPEAEHAGSFSTHLEVPNPLPAQSRLWISLEPESGEALKAGLDLPAAKAPEAKAPEKK